MFHHQWSNIELRKLLLASMCYLQIIQVILIFKHMHSLYKDGNDYWYNNESERNISAHYKKQCCGNIITKVISASVIKLWLYCIIIIMAMVRIRKLTYQQQLEQVPKILALHSALHYKYRNTYHRWRHSCRILSCLQFDSKSFESQEYPMI